MTFLQIWLKISKKFLRKVQKTFMTSGYVDFIMNVNDVFENRGRGEKGGSKVNFWKFLCFNTPENFDNVWKEFLRNRKISTARHFTAIWMGFSVRKGLFLAIE